MASMGNDLKKASGFSLIELMVTIAIIAILLAIADPSYKYITNSNRIAGEVNGLLGDLQYARAEAINEGLNVVVCASSDNSSCAGTSDWKIGWIVFADLNSNGSRDNDEAVLRAQKTFTSTDTFQATPNTLSAVTFNREGFAPGIAANTIIKLHDANNTSKWTRCLSIGLVGLLTVQTYDGTTCT